jgi:hypothetical protein
MIERSQQATADGAGIATITFGNADARQRVMFVLSVAVNVTGSSTRPTCTTYRNYATPGLQLAVKRAGDNGTFTGDDGDRFGTSDALVVQWTGCTPGALCTAVLRGFYR